MERVAMPAAEGRRGLTIDIDRCIGCYNCFVACRDEHVGNAHAGIAAAQSPTGQGWITLREEVRGSYPKVKVSYVPVLCMQCEDAPCLAVGGADGSVYRRADGIVIVDPEKAKGRRDLVESCPYGAIVWNEEQDLPQKCTLCAHLLDDGWSTPRCVEACPTDALVFGDLDDQASEIAALRRERVPEDLRPELGLRPAVGYFQLPRCFVVGEVVLADRPDEPATGASVRLEGGPERLRTTTDAYGDFEFGDVPRNAAHRLRVEYPGYAPVELDIPASPELNVGTITLRADDHRSLRAPRSTGPVVEPTTGLTFYELSHPWGYNTPMAPGYPDVRLQRLTSHAQHGVLSTHVVTVMHGSTHMNAPVHLVPRGAHVGEVAPARFFGNGIVVGVPKGKWELITAEDLSHAGADIRPHDIVLLNTGWHRRYSDSQEYFGHAPGLSPEAAEWLAALPAKLVGIDTAFVDHPLATSMGPQRNGPKIKYLLPEYREATGREAKDDFPDWNPAHRALLGAGIPTIENVGGDLDEVTGLRCTFHAYPWKWTEGDASVIRLVAILDPGGTYRIESGERGDD